MSIPKIEDIQAGLSSFNDKYPFLLFPVRMETRFMKVEIPVSSIPEGGVGEWSLSPNVVRALDEFENSTSIFTESNEFENKNSALANLSNKIQDLSEDEIFVAEYNKISAETSLLLGKVKENINETKEEIKEAEKEVSKISYLKQANENLKNNLDAKLAELLNTEGDENDGDGEIPDDNEETADDNEEEEIPSNDNFLNEFSALSNSLQTILSSSLITYTDILSGAEQVIIEISSVVATLDNVSSLSVSDVDNIAEIRESFNSNFANFEAKETTFINNGDANIATYNNQIETLNSSQGNILAGVESNQENVISASDGNLSDNVRPGHIVKTGDGTWGVQNTIVHELYVRVYPDDIAITSHGEELSIDEVELGKRYWNYIWEYPNNEEREKSIWSTLVDTIGANRAAWVVKTLAPEVPSGVADLESRNGQINIQETNYTTLLDTVPEYSLSLLGFDYWQEVWSAYGDNGIESSFWNSFVTEIGNADLALIVANLTRPLNIGEKPSQNQESDIRPIFPTEEEIISIAADYLESGLIFPIYSSPQFPGITSIPNAWSEASYTDMMPGNFIFTIYSAGSTAGSQFLGAAIPDTLDVSLSPDLDETNPTLELNDGTGDIDVLNSSFEWMVDFDAAVTSGMGIVIPLQNGEEVDGISRITAFGVKLNKNADESQEAIQKLIEGHQYSHEGFSIVPQGTPTNNTDQGAAGYNTFDLGADKSFSTYRKGPLFTDEIDPLKKTDGQWLAETLGIDSEYLKNIQFADGKDIAESMAMNQALFMGSTNTYMEVLLKELFLSKDMTTIRSIRDFFTNYVSARGFNPAIRVGTQPYGILTTSTFDSLDWKQYTNGLSTDEIDYFQDYFQAINNINGFYEEKVDEIAFMSKSITGATQQEMEDNAKLRFLEILGLSATSVDYFYRYAVGEGPEGDLPGLLAANGSLDKLLPNKGVEGFYERALANLSNASDWDDYLHHSLLYLKESYKLSSLGEDGNYEGGIIEERPLSETEGLEKIFGDGTLNYIQNLLEKSFTSIYTRSFSTEVEDEANQTKSLLYLMLKHSMLLQYFDTCMDLLDTTLYHTFKINSFTGSSIVNIQFPNSENQNIRVIPFEEGSYIHIPHEQGKFENFVELKVNSINFDTMTVSCKLISGKLGDVIGNPDVRAYGNYGIRIRKNLGDSIHVDPNDLINNSLGKVINHKLGMITPITTLLEGKVISPKDYLENQLNDGKFEEQKKYLKEVLNAMEVIAELPTAKLERLFAEHVDLFSYRIDAWRQALAVHRLQQTRNEVDPITESKEYEKGLYIGSYGWLEDLKPKEQTLLAEEDYPDEYTFGTDTLYVDETNQGFVHAPSLNHAVTAAVLRAGFLAHANSNEASLLSVNMSSDRVRMALNYLDGLRNGQTLGALLGYQFERGLHDRSNDDIQLDQYILEFRNQYSLVKDLNEVTETTNSESIKARNVVDGIELLKESKNSDGTSAYPFGIPISTAAETYGLPPVNTTDSNEKDIIAAIEAEIDRMRNAMDAIADLSLVESVYGVIQGNYDRTNAILNAISSGTNPPEPEVVHTPRGGYRFTNKLGILFGPKVTPSPKYGIDDVIQSIVPNTIATNVKSIAEPQVNNWIDSILGSLSDIKFTVIYEGGSVISKSIDDIYLDYSEFVYLLSTELKNDSKALTNYINFVIRREETIDTDTLIEVNYTDRSQLSSADQTDYSIKMIGEILPMAESMMDLLLNGKLMDAEDLRSPDTEFGTVVNSKGFDYDDLLSRIEGALGTDSSTGLKLVEADLITIEATLDVTDLYSVTLSDLELARVHLMRAFTYGIESTIPNSVLGELDDDKTSLLNQVQYVIKEVSLRVEEADLLVTEAKNSTDVDEKIDKLIAASKSIFGADYRIIPLFNADNWQDIDDSRDSLDGANFMEEDWLNGVAHVREASSKLQDLNLQIESLDGTWDMQAIQLPFNSAETWLGNTDGGGTIDSDRFSLVLHYDGSISNTLQSGLIIDEWVEVIPQTKQTTGVAFNYDQPNAEAPQALLLAVSPDITGSWELDDLMNILNNTIHNVKKRAVEPDYLDQTYFNFGLPTLVNSALKSAYDFGLDFGTNVGKDLDDEIPFIDSDGTSNDYYDNINLNSRKVIR